ncbi:MAG: hypothetical protein ACPG5B_01685 [Chitinophagales bacterium]
MHNTDKKNAQNIISKKKNFYTVNAQLKKYLVDYQRFTDIPLEYADLKRYHFSTPLLNQNGEDTLWESVYYTQMDMEEIHSALIEIYVILKAAGDQTIAKHLHIEQVDYCTFGNSNPFRIKVVNNFNDNYDYFYVKIADASRIYGLELEHILSPNRINYLVHKNTLIEEHIAGIPGDQFLEHKFSFANTAFNETRIAKEFVKFNERCFVKLLGDMRSYNFVIDITPDFDDIQYRIRAIDFDQQCYEGSKKLYLPQFFKENLPYVKLCIKRMSAENVRQYQREERALIANRIRTSRYRLTDLIEVLVKDRISTDEKVRQLRDDLARHYQQPLFLTCKTMGQIVKTSLNIVFDSKVTSSYS